jgi:hypothetical protein
MDSWAGNITMPNYGRILGLQGQGFLTNGQPLANLLTLTV